ncbi:MAG TPA: hypothetical protein DF383_06810, partial [Deltaproteobacteria bacterium]|nr:hypothetical protein [Deltaproteobacteria bacterium]
MRIFYIPLLLFVFFFLWAVLSHRKNSRIEQHQALVHKIADIADLSLTYYHDMARIGPHLIIVEKPEGHAVRVACFRLPSGQLEWKSKWADQVFLSEESKPTIILIAREKNDEITAQWIDIDSGKAARNIRFQIPGLSEWTDWFFHGEHLYAFSSHEVINIDAKTGRVLWRWATQDLILNQSPI